MSNSKNDRIVKLLQKNPGIGQREAEKKLGFTMVPSTLWRARKTLEGMAVQPGTKTAPARRGHMASIPIGDPDELALSSASEFDGFFGDPIQGLPKQPPHRPAVTVKRTFNVGTKETARKGEEEGKLMRVFRVGDVDTKMEAALQRILHMVSKTSGVGISLARLSPDNDLEVRVSVEAE